ncbi:S-adenosyl-L-methionine-dependent methyltransferase [Podospora didyma]|uniref:S-adenosyl-L-methionine-dependent methyltransferase n=1 Tax=Podospora didyma TaxID=330526 RepID=A0AAE0NU16_9PEZI|nr:S-adenosyl-L-methionine-dependent methyltransferase [Podospora didyma]
MRITSIKLLSPSSSLRLINRTNQFRAAPRLWARNYFAMVSIEGDGAVKPAQAAPAVTTSNDLVPGAKRQYTGNAHNKKPFKKQRRKDKKPAEGSHDEVLMADIIELEEKLAAQKLADEDATAAALPEQGSEIEVDVMELSSTGEGLALQRGSHQIYVVPFSIPGDTVKIKVYRHNEHHSVGDFISVIKPSPLRDDSRIQCKYFGVCSGCQFQMLDYAEQLRRKRDIVVKAYRNFSQLAPELVPEILDTIGSPLEYGYRTKLTPHFDGPPGAQRRGPKVTHPEMPPFGFTPKATRKVLDIEDCPIATDAVRKGLVAERARLAVEYGTYSKGATILLRESTKRVPNGATGEDARTETEGGIIPPIVVEADTFTDYKTCITDNNATSTEYIDDFVFTNPAGSFFQNNNSILPPFTEYIREHILPPASPTAKPIRNLIDAYSGSGLFTITQASLFPGGSIGIDIAEKSIDYARKNAALNGLSDGSSNDGKPICKFIAADAPALFKSVSQYDPDETVVVLDPPRKGCDHSFLTQLLKFAPRRIVYVSCNVHTQARDVGVLVRGQVPGGAKKQPPPVDAFDAILTPAETDQKPVRYDIESIRGFDFFPQTGHVEGVAILSRIDV